MNARLPSVAIIGAGMSGICMAITLLEAGIDEVTIYEKAQDLGGTWRDNTYPGLSCDVPSRFYQFTFAPNAGWSHFFSPGAEIHAYFSEVAERYGLRERIRFGTEVVAAEFADHRWRIQTQQGERSEVDFLISATGILRIPSFPRIEGIDTFEGAMFHSARWDHSVDLTGKRVAVIGTGSTGVQIVCGLADTVEKLEMYQRSAQWILPFPNRAYRTGARLAHDNVPGLNRFSYVGTRTVFEYFSRALTRPGWRRSFVSALCRANLASVRDPELRRKLTPDYEPMCKRLVVSSAFYPAMQRDHVDLVTEGIDHIDPRGIVTADGALHEVDAIVLATGFDAHAFMRPMQLIGRDGQSIEDAWADGPRAFHTIAVPNFPNFFMLLGPHSPVGNYSLTAIAETQASHIRRWIERWRRSDFDSVSPTPEATEAFNAEMRAAMPDTVWASGCDSWYLGKDGNPELWPWTPDRHRRLLAKIDLGAYDVRRKDPAEVVT